MTKTQRNIIVIAIILASGLLFYFIWVNRKRKNDANNFVIAESLTEYQASIPELDTNKVLKLGSKGDEVKELQRLVNKALQQSVFTLAYLNVDGDFGSLTENATVNVFGLDQITLTDAYNMSNNILNIN